MVKIDNTQHRLHRAMSLLRPTPPAAGPANVQGGLRSHRKDAAAGVPGLLRAPQRSKRWETMTICRSHLRSQKWTKEENTRPDLLSVCDRTGDWQRRDEQEHANCGSQSPFFFTFPLALLRARGSRPTAWTLLVSGGKTNAAQHRMLARGSPV
jgi:hypothetical protein